MRSSFTDRLVTVALFAVPVLFGLYALAMGQDANWDLRNYHWYNPYAFLHGRLSMDLGVAQIASFYNPLLDLPIYLLGTHLPARLVGFLLGTVHGLNYVLLYVLAVRLLTDVADVIPPPARRGAAALVALVGAIGGEHLSLVGTTFNDNIVSLAVLGGAILVLKHGAALFAPSVDLPRRAEMVPLVIAGALIGLAVGIKLPTAPFAVGFCVGFLCVGGGLARRFANAFLFGCGVLAGFIVVGAPWMAVMWRDYANPIFPYFNGIFHSPLGLADSYRDMRYLPTSPLGALARPLTFTLDPNYGSEITLRDLRVLAGYVLLWATAALAIARCLRNRGAAPLLTANARYLIAAAVFSYVPWLLIFGVHRYIVLLEMLAPLLSVVVLAAWPLSVRLRRVAIVALLAVLTVTTQPGDWEHVPWQDGAFVTVTPPPVAAPDQTMAIVAGTNPVGWLVPYFPPQIPFIRIDGYLINPTKGQNGLNDRAHTRIAAHQGPLYALFPKYEVRGTSLSLRSHGLSLDVASCQPVTSNLGDYARWCRVERNTAGPAGDDLPPVLP